MVCALDAAHVAAESVFIQLFFCLAVPEPACVGADFVGEYYLAFVSAEFYLEIDEVNAHARKEFFEYFVYFARHALYLFELGFGRPAERKRVVGVYHGVAQFVRFVVQFQNRHGRDFALRQARALGQRTRDHVAHYDFERNYLHVLDKRVAVRQLLDVMRFYSLFGEQAHEVVAHAVVDYALADDSAFFKTVERRRVVLVADDDQVGIARCKHLFGFALVKLFFLLRFHLCISLKCRLFIELFL